jgi:hypothetical protein
LLGHVAADSLEGPVGVLARELLPVDRAVAGGRVSERLVRRRRRTAAAVVDWADWAGRDPTDIRVKVFCGQELVGLRVESDQRLHGRAYLPHGGCDVDALSETRAAEKEPLARFRSGRRRR